MEGKISNIVHDVRKNRERANLDRHSILKDYCVAWDWLNSKTELPQCPGLFVKMKKNWVRFKEEGWILRETDAAATGV